MKQAKYSYSDVIIAWMITSFCGGQRLDHISKLRKNLDIIPDLRLPSHDTLGRVMKSMATEIFVEEEVNRSKLKPKEALQKGRKTYKRITKREINNHDPLNNLLVRATCSVGMLKPKIKYDLDLDATTIATECRDAKKTYKKFRGFSPMVATINEMPVYVEMRNGNVAPSARIYDCTQACINNLKKHNISIGRLRMDGGGYNAKTLDFLDDENIKFCVGVMKSPRMMSLITNHKEWTQTRIDTSWHVWDCESANIEYNIMSSERVYRLIVLRINKHKRFAPKGWLTHDLYGYKVIVTNDFETSADELISFYNKRGTSEQNFSNLKNEFAWRLPPFSNMNENTVFLLIAALTNNVYLGLVNRFKKSVKKIRTNARLKDFIFTFMSVACEIIDGTAVFYNTDIPYEKIC